MTISPAPSPTTKPSRWVSKGRQALVGSSRRVEAALRLQALAISRRVQVDSAPPATTMSQAPERSIWWAVPMATVPEEQAVETAWLGPWTPRSRLTLLAAPLTTLSGASFGETRRGPRPASAACCSS